MGLIVLGALSFPTLFPTLLSVSRTLAPGEIADSETRRCYNCRCWDRHPWKPCPIIRLPGRKLVSVAIILYCSCCGPD